MPTALLRCDGGPNLGIGHVMRCRALAAAFREQGWTSAFAMTQASAKLFSSDDPIIVDHGVSGAAATRIAMIERDAGCLVIDHYGLDAEFERQVANAGALILAIDDLANRRHDCDLLVDTNPARTAADYAAYAAGTQLLLGARYALLRPEFAELRRAPADIVRGAPRRLLAVLGGADPDNVSALVLGAVPQLRTAGLEVTLIVGGANPRQVELVGRGRALGADVLCDPPNAVALMAGADIAISGAGTTCLEFACLGIPAVALILADNQRSVAKALADTGTARVLDATRSLESRELADIVVALAAAQDARRRMSEAGQALIDGKGAARVAAEAVRLHALRNLKQCL
jgi:UDP-2,4-diacetamido-2,4,6-trideoxy-beta-L-altropyranose hydrolase